MADADRVTAVDAIARLATPRDRGDAQRALLDAGSGVVPALLRTLREAGGETARATIETLGLMGDLRAVTPLRRILRRSAPELACAAAEALGHIPHGAAVWALREGLDSPHRSVRIETALSLARHAASPEALLTAQADECLHSLAPADVPSMVEALLWRLPPSARDVAFAHTVRVDPGSAIATALPHLHRHGTAQSARDALRRIEAVHPLIFQLAADTAVDILPVLADIGNHLQVNAGGSAREDRHDRQDADDPTGVALHDIVAVLIDWYDPGEPALAAVIVEGLRSLGDYALGALHHRLAHADADERPYIVALLQALEWSPAKDATTVGDCLAAGEWERVAALGPDAVEPLLAAFRGRDLGRREGAARALMRLGWEPEDRVGEYRLALALGRWDALPRRDAAARALLLEDMAEERATARAAPAHGANERAPRRIAMTRALARFPGDASIRGLLDALRDDPSPQVREEAARALEEKGRDAVSAILDELAHRQKTRGNDASFRCDLIHLLARRGGHARAATGVLQRLARRDPSLLVCDAARAALARIAAPDRRAATVRGAAPAGGGDPSPGGVSLGPHAGADVGLALRGGGQVGPEALAERLDSRDPAEVGRAVAAIVSMGRAGGSVLPALERVLCTASLSGRRAAMQALDRLGLLPKRPEAQAAYYLARGDLKRCEAIGGPARVVLREALPLLDWRSAGAVALSLLRLGEPLWSPALGSVIDLLERVASLPDTHVDGTLPRDDARRTAGARDVSLAVSRAADRRAARELLTALQAEAVRRR